MHIVRANGLQAWSVLGLLSNMVGLLRSCVDYQEVIVSSLAYGSEEIYGRFSLTVFFRLCYHNKSFEEWISPVHSTSNSCENVAYNYIFPIGNGFLLPR
jgi:hypothetical protein